MFYLKQHCFLSKFKPELTGKKKKTPLKVNKRKKKFHQREFQLIYYLIFLYFFARNHSLSDCKTMNFGVNRIYYSSRKDWLHPLIPNQPRTVFCFVMLL